MPKWLIPAIVLMASLSFIPLSLIMLKRSGPADLPRFELIPDMDNQQKFKPQSFNPMFADARSMRPPVAGAVPYKKPRLDDHLEKGIDEGKWADDFPSGIQVNEEFITRGREKYNVFCAPCHGLSGYGNGPVAVRAEELAQGTWTPPSSYHTELVLGRPAGHIFNTITNGIRNMPAYGPQIPVEDRWAIVAYVRALQRSQNAKITDLPEDVRKDLMLRAGADAASGSEVFAGDENGN